MKRHLTRGGDFLHKWQGEPPSGRSMPTEYNQQKGQPQANPEPELVLDKSQKTIIRVWRF